MVDFGQNIKYGFQCKVDSHSVSRICIAPMDFEISPENWKGRADIVTDGAPRRIPLWFTQRSSRWPCEAPRPNCPLCWTRNSRRKLPHWRITMIATTKHPTVHTNEYNHTQILGRSRIRKMFAKKITDLRSHLESIPDLYPPHPRWNSLRSGRKIRRNRHPWPTRFVHFSNNFITDLWSRGRESTSIFCRLDQTYWFSATNESIKLASPGVYFFANILRFSCVLAAT